MSDGEQWHLLLGFILGCFGPGPYPMLCLEGEPGAGKSTLMETIRSLVDPEMVTRAANPRSVEDLMVSAAHRWIVSLDNLSGLRKPVSDALCLLLTGGAYARRRLYRSLDESIIRRVAPVLCTGVDPIATSPDLISRTILLELRRRQEHVPESVLYARLHDIRPSIMAEICDILVSTLRNRERVATHTADTRLADHVQWVEAAAHALGWKSGYYAGILARMQARALRRAVILDPVMHALVTYLDDHPTLVGTSGELLETLSDPRYASPNARTNANWPRTPEGMSATLRRLAPMLAADGVGAYQGTGRERRTWTISRMSG